jgi:PAS domain S-box-containing protein
MDGIVTSWNKGAERLYGYTAEEIVGQPVSLLVPSERGVEMRVIMDRVHRGERIEHVETVRLRKDGRLVDVSLTISAIRDAEGRLKGVSKIARDITGRKRAEAALRESEARLAAELQGMTQLHALSTRLLTTFDLRPALEAVLDDAIRISGADFGNIQLSSPQNHALEIVVQRGFQRDFLDHFHTVRVDEGSCCSQAMQCAERVVVEDVELDPSFEPHRAIAASAGFRSVQSTPLKSRAGSVIGMLSTHYREPKRPSERDERLLDLVARHVADLVERHGFEEALRRREAQFRQLADAMPQIVWTAGADGVVDYSNRRWHEFTGLATAVGNQGWSEMIHPDDLPLAVSRWAECLPEGRPFELEVRLRDRRTGTYRWHLMRTVPERDETGAAVRWYGTATDIDEQKRAGEAARFLSEASVALATLVDSESTLQRVASLAVPYFADWAAVDLAGDGGQFRRLAVAHEEPEMVRLAEELFDRYPPYPNEDGGIGRVFRTGEPEIVGEITDEMLVRGARDEGHLRLLRSLGLRSYICVPLVVSGKQFGAITFATAQSGRKYARGDLALAQDLAHRAAVAIENANLYSALREEDRRKSEFLATLAHELRNPLAPLRSGLQIMRLAPRGSQALEDSRAMMERQLEYMVRLVDDLLEVSRISRGKLELRKERVTLSEIVSSAVETCDPLVEQHEDELTVTLPEEPVSVHADKTRISQALCNLLSNAVKYSDRGSQIRLTATREGDDAVISIRDTGIGIPPEMLAKVFDLFAQADSSLEKSQGGLGIGLTIAQRLVEMHGGSVEARSEGLGKGSEFVIRLPIHSPAEEEPKKPGVSQVRSSSQRRVLVADDNRDAALSLAMVLKLKGNETATAHDGVDAVAVAAAFDPDVILLDIGMPKLNGFDAARRIRQETWGKNVVLVAVTGWGQEDDRKRSAAAGFDLHLTKPVDPVALEELLASLDERDRGKPGEPRVDSRANSHPQSSPDSARVWP